MTEKSPAQPTPQPSDSQKIKPSEETNVEEQILNPLGKGVKESDSRPEEKSSIFGKLTDFSYKRSPAQAAGFYVAYLVLLIIVSVILGAVFGLATGQESFEVGVTFGTIVAVAFSLAISFLVLYKKNLYSDFRFIIVALLSGLLAIIGGGLLGLLPTAFLTTR